MRFAEFCLLWFRKCTVLLGDIWAVTIEKRHFFCRVYVRFVISHIVVKELQLWLSTTFRNRDWLRVIFKGQFRLFIVEFDDAIIQIRERGCDFLNIVQIRSTCKAHWSVNALYWHRSLNEGRLNSFLFWVSSHWYYLMILSLSALKWINGHS